MYKRIIILGGSGSGKSTLASRISEFTGYPVYHLDNLFLDSNWDMKSREEREEISKQFLSKDVGVVDGNYRSVLSNRINWADLIIFTDISTFERLYRIFRRLVRVRLGFDKNSGAPEGRKQFIDKEFLLWSLRWNKNQKPKTFSMLKEVKDKKVIIIKEPRKLDIKSLLE